MSALLERADHLRIPVGEVEIAASVVGSGPPLLLLHGYPQSRTMWHSVAPLLAEDYTLVISDLRGYGESSAPEGGDHHRAYSKRAMAADQVAVMAELGFSRFDVVGHDRGGRVAHRMALDHPHAVTRLAVLDIVPTRVVFATANQAVVHGLLSLVFSDPARRAAGKDDRRGSRGVGPRAIGALVGTGRPIPSGGGRGIRGPLLAQGDHSRQL